MCCFQSVLLMCEIITRTYERISCISDIYHSSEWCLEADVFIEWCLLNTAHCVVSQCEFCPINKFDSTWLPSYFYLQLSRSVCVCEQSESSQEPVWTGPQRHAAQVWLILHVLSECSVYILVFLTEVQFDLIFFWSDVFAIVWLVKINRSFVLCPYRCYLHFQIL